MALFGRPTETDRRREAAYREWFARQHPLALASLVLSIFSLTHFGTLWLDEIAGIILAVITLAQLRNARRGGEGKTEGDRLAWAAIAVGVLSLALAFTIYFGLGPRR